MYIIVKKLFLDNWSIYLHAPIMWIFCGASRVTDAGPHHARRGSEQGVIWPEAAHAEGRLFSRDVHIV